MPQPGEAVQPTPSAEDSFLELLVEILEGLDEPVRGQFLRQFFHTIAQIDLTEEQSNEYWDRTLVRRRELTDSLGKKVSLKTALVDVRHTQYVLSSTSAPTLAWLCKTTMQLFSCFGACKAPAAVAQLLCLVELSQI